MTCPDCGTTLDEVPVGEPCPNCGGLRRNATVQLQPARVSVITPSVGISVGYGPDRPWQQKWRDIKHELDQLRDTYTQRSMSNDPVRRQVEDFFKDCRELADWIKRSAGRPEAMSYVNTDPDLRLCDGMAQTTKHHTRTPSRANPDPITARITSIDSGWGVRAEIGWSSLSGASGTEDALDLARRCVAAWQRFFQQYGLSPDT